jgi:hypothetical protein
MSALPSDGSIEHPRGQMNIRSIQQGLKYRDRVKAVRQTYYVFEAKDHYFVLSLALSKARKGSGYFNLVSQEAVDYVQARFGGKSGVTAKAVMSAARRTAHIPTSLTALNVLYILVALGQASILRSGEHRQLFFALRRSH